MTIFREGIDNNKRRFPSVPNHMLSKNICLEKIGSVVQQIVCRWHTLPR